ncbi:MAG: DUF4139 domain-containing protein [Phycisphaerales bacterium]|nr:DUF4139 domain-containing protein [Phycisphaerales bacterium]
MTKHTIRYAAALLTLGAMLPGALADDTALTIYSTAAPGAIPAEWYRPVPGQNQGSGYNRYNQIPGYAVIRQDRTLEIEQGLSELKFTDVAAMLDPTTVRFSSLTDPDGTSVLEQSYRFDLLSMGRMLERYIDQTIIHNGQEVTLMSTAAGGMLLQLDDGRVQFQQGYSGVVFPSLDESLVTKPTLLWMVDAAKGGEHETRVSYQTTGITWWADYNLVYTEGKDANHGTMDIGAWVSILNQSGGTYENAKLKLVAGDVHRAQPQNRYAKRERVYATADAVGGAAGFAEKSFFEYHLYTLGRPTTIPDRSTKQIELFEAVNGVPADKILMYDGTAQAQWFGGSVAMDQNWGVQSNSKVAVFLRFDNTEENGMGIPLPSGRIRVNQLDEADGAYEFIGEHVIDHTPQGETIMIKLGNAFDVVGERRQVSFERGKRWIIETIEVKLRNRKDVPVDVVVQERLYRWSNAKIQKISHDYEMLDARTMHIPVSLEPDEEGVVTYTVRYSW